MKRVHLNNGYEKQKEDMIGYSLALSGAENTQFDNADVYEILCKTSPTFQTLSLTIGETSRSSTFLRLSIGVKSQQGFKERSSHF